MNVMSLQPGRMARPGKARARYSCTVGIPGTILLGRYRVVRPIARGALATVYLAFDAHGTAYAVKVFPKTYAARADREWKVGRALEHPNINPVLERVSIEGFPAVLLAFAPGERLSTWNGESLEAFLSVFHQLLRALAHVHERGFVHRDVKPENLIVAASGKARLVDFDLSGPIGERFPGRLRIGTLGYLAPEQVRGIPPVPATDLYAAGVLLYWGIFRELPFSGAPHEVMRAHLKQPVRLPPRPRIPSNLAQYLLRLLAKDPQDRFQNGAEALAAFEAL